MQRYSVVDVMSAETDFVPALLLTLIQRDTPHYKCFGTHHSYTELAPKRARTQGHTMPEKQLPFVPRLALLSCVGGLAFLTHVSAFGGFLLQFLLVYPA